MIFDERALRCGRAGGDLYVGRTERSAASRIREHFDQPDRVARFFASTGRRGLLCKVGQFVVPSRPNSELLADVEASVICGLQPSVNVVNRRSYRGRELHVLHRGDHRPLDPRTTRSDRLDAFAEGVAAAVTSRLLWEP